MPRASPGLAAERKRQREVVTPDGLSLPVIIASAGARAGALLIDLAIIVGAVLAVIVVLVSLGTGMLDLFAGRRTSPALELLAVVLIGFVFLARYGYFLFFELGPRGATPGKRVVGIRVAARPGAGRMAGALSAEAVIARNLMRDFEVFLPAIFLLSRGYADGISGIATFVWLAIFVLLPLFNRDRLRAGDLVAGTWVVEAERRILPSAMSAGEVQAPDRSAYRFGPAELSAYGEHELQVLEDILRRDDAVAMRRVTEAICRKLGWQAGSGDEREFLAAYYAALRDHLERGMRLGRRKKDKHDR